ncbi:MAG: gliding motility-associated C-terminal domain-containing protein [Saprospiraceae bacterium]|nr:gliding motility-associated C-terminal domain-containing protein [Saprospiraceae bacterium]
MKIQNWMYKYSLLCLLLLANLAQAQENGAFSCSDGIDNDQNGWIDCDDPACLELSTEACAFCASAKGFAAFVLDYQPGCTGLELNNPAQALGFPDWQNPTDGKVVVLGEGGSIKLAFNSQVLVNSGDNEADLWVFEIGDFAESCRIGLRPFDTFTRQAMLSSGLSANENFYWIGMIGGAEKSVDIDISLSGYSYGMLKFDAVLIEDVPELSCEATINPGADLDAICGVNMLELDCAGVPEGLSEFNECGICLLPSHPAFFEPCINELYIPNAFSPNDDGINDVFQVFPEEIIDGSIQQFLIFDRWGNLIYQAQSLDLRASHGWWDGGEAPDGIYAYWMEITFNDGQTEQFSGSIHLLR